MTRDIISTTLLTGICFGLRKPRNWDIFLYPHLRGHLDLLLSVWLSEVCVALILESVWPRVMKLYESNYSGILAADAFYAGWPEVDNPTTWNQGHRAGRIHRLVSHCLCSYSPRAVGSIPNWLSYLDQAIQGSHQATPGAYISLINYRRHCPSSTQLPLTRVAARDKLSSGVGSYSAQQCPQGMLPEWQYNFQLQSSVICQIEAPPPSMTMIFNHLPHLVHLQLMKLEHHLHWSFL